MESFDEWFKKKFRDLHDAILCGDLIAGNYKKVSKKSYEAGQQSKQDEVDELIDTIKTASESEIYLFDELQKVKNERDELQKRIDELEGKNKILGMRLDVI